MKKKAYRVHVIVDSHHGDRIRELPIGEPAWVVDSTDNQPVVQAIWRERKETDKLEGITSFKVDPKATPADWLISELDTIDLHHGELSHDPPYSILNVIGVKPSERIKEELAQFGLTEIRATSDGFEAKKKLGRADCVQQVALAALRASRTTCWTGPRAGLPQASLLQSITWPVSPAPFGKKGETNAEENNRNEVAFHVCVGRISDAVFITVNQFCPRPSGYYRPHLHGH